MEQAIVDFLLEHSPPWSGPVYLAIARHWDTVQLALLVFFCVIFLVSVWFALSTLTSYDD